MATETDNVNAGALGTLTAVGTFAMLGIALVVTALVRAETAEEVARKDVGADRPYRDLAAEQTSLLNAPPAYVDRAKGVVTLPLERAMELTVLDLAKNPSSATPASGQNKDAPPAPAPGAAAVVAPGASAGAEMPAPTTPGAKGSEVPAGAKAPAAPAAPPAPQKQGDNSEKKSQEQLQDKKLVPAVAPARPSVPAAAPGPTPAAPAPPAAPVPAPPNGQ